MLIRFAFALVACSAMPAAASAQNDVAGTLVTLTGATSAPNGAWSWFQDERAIIDDSDPQNRLLLVSSVSSGGGGSTERGDVDLHWLNVDTGVVGTFELHDRLENDDHDSAALHVRPDGRYVALYSKHGSDQSMRWRVSSNPGDPTSWGPEQSIDGSGANSSGVTYSNVYDQPNDNFGSGRLYDFSRAQDWNPALIVSNDDGSSWSPAGKLLTAPGQRPYLRYFGDGDKIHFTATDGHPRDANNSIYHGYVQDGQLFNSNGVLVDANLFDSSAIAPTGLTTVFAANTVVNGVPMTRAWTVDVGITAGGEPYTVFQARIDPGSVSGGQASLDHQFFYARFDLSSGTWTVNPLALAGRDIYAASPNGPEDDYTGLAAVDPDDPNTVFISTNIDPISKAALPHYEIFRGVTADGGATWAWDPITANSTVDNVRPIVPKWNAQDTALLWMRGNYATYQSWSTQVVALTEIGVLTPSVLDTVTYIDADTGNQPGTANTTEAFAGAFTPSMSGSAAPSNNMWHERTGFANGGDVLASAPGSDSPRLRTTITGLTAGAEYAAYAYYWVAVGTGAPTGNNAWDVAAGLTQLAMVEYAWSDGVQINDPARFSNTVLLDEGNRALFEVALGTAIADASGSFDIFIDDVPGNAFRTWYDGVGFAAASGTLGTPYCQVNANSVGLTAQLSASGSLVASDNNVTFLGADLVPGQFGIMVNSDAMGFTPNVGTNGSGNLCLDGTIGRFNRPGEIVQISPSGSMSFSADLTDIPRAATTISIASGETWFFQFWHRDFAGGSPSSNLTNGLEITLQ